MDNNEPNLKRDWSFKINLSGVTAPRGGRKMDVTEGHYSVVCSDAYINDDRNPNRVVFKFIVKGGQFDGAELTDGINLPKNDEDKVRVYWRGMAESAGYSPADLDAGEIEMAPSTFLNRTFGIHYVPKDEAAGRRYDNVKYLTPASFSQHAQSAAGSNGAAAGAPTLGGTGTTRTKSDVMASLGL